jgi:tetratricopeptide (TPR) repeat protein
MLRGQFAKAEQLLTEGLQTLGRNPGVDDGQLATILGNRSVCLSNLGRVREATADAQRALDMLEAERHSDPFTIARLLNNMAALSHSTGHDDEAEGYFRRAVSYAGGSPDMPFWSAVFRNYAILLRARGRKTEAKEMEQRARSIERTGQGPGRHTVDVTELSVLPR